MQDSVQVSLCAATRELMQAYYREFVSDPDLFMDMSAFFTYQYDPDRVDAYFAARQSARDRKNFMVMLDGRPIGELSLKRIDYEKKECTLSIHLQNDSVKNKGDGTQAERLALAHAFETLGMETVLADCVLKNERSRHVLEKIGFRFIGQDDTFRYYRYDRG